MRRCPLLPALILAVVACAATQRPRVIPPSTTGPAAGVTDARLRDLFTRHWDWLMEQSPVWATTLGDHRFDDRIGDPSARGVAEFRAARARFLADARAIPAASLAEPDRTHLRLFVDQLERGLATDVCEFETWAVSVYGNPVTQWNYLPEQHHITSWEDGRHLVARYRAIPSYIDQGILNLRRGAAAGRFANAETVRRVIAILDAQLAQPEDDWPLLAPAGKVYEGWSDQQHFAFVEDLVTVVAVDIKPAFARYRALLHDELLLKARSDADIGLAALPGGAECYAAMIHDHTSVPFTARELHDLGLAEIARIDAEIAALGQKVFGAEVAPDLPAVLARLRTPGPDLYFTSADEIEATATELLARAQAKVPEWFGLQPKAECVVRRIPDYEAPYTTIAYYQPPHPDGSKPGEYYVNVYQPTTRPRFEAEALAFHEAVPGHHLQIAITQELGALPTFRKYLDATVFTEGWALYTEQLADEMGLYSSDLTRLGKLSYEAWRASRLVVDTGIHALGWSRQQAKDYMAAHTALAENNIDNEVDRYINTPGQALAYKVGQLEILRLRADARATLGAKFDIKAFHDALLDGGAVTLPVLRERVAAWVASKS